MCVCVAELCLCAIVCSCVYVCARSVFYLLGSCIVWVQRQHSPGSDLYKGKVAEISHLPPTTFNCQPPPCYTTPHGYPQQAEIVATWVSSNVSTSSSSSSSSSATTTILLLLFPLYLSALWIFVPIDFQAVKITCNNKKNKKKTRHVMCSSYVCG